MFLILWFNVRIVTVDISKKTISFKDFLLRSTNIYSFSDLDGYFEKITRHQRSFMPYDTICFVKDKKVIEKIDSFYYSNLKDLKIGLKDLKYLGFKKFDLLGREK